MLEGTGRFYELRFNSRFYEGQGRRVSATAWQYAGVQRCESGVRAVCSGVRAVGQSLGGCIGRSFVLFRVCCSTPPPRSSAAVFRLPCSICRAAGWIRRFPRACGTALVSHLIEDGGRWEGCGRGGLFLDVML
jgi:hypothetical protein